MDPPEILYYRGYGISARTPSVRHAQVPDPMVVSIFKGIPQLYKRQCGRWAVDLAGKT